MRQLNETLGFKKKLLVLFSLKLTPKRKKNQLYTLFLEFLCAFTVSCKSGDRLKDVENEILNRRCCNIKPGLFFCFL